MEDKKLISVGSVLSVFSFSTVDRSVRSANFCILTKKESSRIFIIARNLKFKDQCIKGRVFRIMLIFFLLCYSSNATFSFIMPV